MSPIGMQFVTIASNELVGLKVGASVADAVGMSEVEIAAIQEPRRLAEVVAKWNAFAAQHRPLPRLVLYDRGDRSEIMLGSRA